MKVFTKRLKVMVFAVVVAGTLGFGAAQAFATDPDTGCPAKPGCQFGGHKLGCCVVP